MRNRILASSFMILSALLSTAVGVAAYFTATAGITNNTFATGSLALRLFYDCPGETEQAYGTNNDYTIVECPINGDGSDERQEGGGPTNALKYGQDDGGTYTGIQIFNNEGDWTPANGWWAGLSSAIDHTNIFPGWSASRFVTSWEDTDLVSVGNSGTLPLNLFINVGFEASGEDEENEPLDGMLPTPQPMGGDRIDPHLDAEWISLMSKVYDTGLASQINVFVERVGNNGTTLFSFSGTLKELIDAGDYALGSLEPNEVAYVRFNWEMDESVSDAYQSLFFDYTIDFNATQTNAPAPVAP